MTERALLPHESNGDAQETLAVPEPRKKKEPALTEGQLVDRLKGRYEGDSGNGPAGCVVAQVRDAAGFDSRRTIDALGFHFWPSRGLLIDAYECKSSRSDWLRELEDHAKADRFCQLADRFYVVAGRKDLVKVDEVPPDWGLLVPHGDKLKEVKPAVVLHADSPAVAEWATHAQAGRRAAGPRPLPAGFDRSFLVAIVRQAFKITNVAPAEIRAAHDDGYTKGLEQGARETKRELERLRELETVVREFEGELGYPIKGYRNWAPRGVDLTPADVGRTLRQILNGDADVTALRNRLSSAAQTAERLAEEARQKVDALDAALGQTTEKAA